MKIIEVIVAAGHSDTLQSIAEKHEAEDYWAGLVTEDGRQVISILVSPDNSQNILDAIQSALGSSEKSRINVLPLEVTLPHKKEDAEKEDSKKKQTIVTREELYRQIKKGSKLDGNFLLLVFLSTIVAAIGLIDDNVAVVIGAMVIAPLLGPNLALAFATSLGDKALMWESLKTNVAGLVLALGLSILIGLVWDFDNISAEVMNRTDVGIAGVILALASGAAAVLSLATGASSALVGVMVAVAILPPTATLGMMLGSGYYNYALGAALLLAVNIVCVNISAKLVFLYRGIKPRTWLEKQKAKQSMALYSIFWIVLLLVLLGAMYIRHNIS